MVQPTPKTTRTHCMDCADELTAANANRRTDRANGWHGRCRECQRKHRRNQLQEAEKSRRIFITRDVCDICGEPERQTRAGQVRMLNKDHDHETGEWRGLLCSRCNVGIGMLGDNVASLQKAIDYLTNPPGLVLLDDNSAEARRAG